MKIIEKNFYTEYKYGVSIFSGERVCILGTQTMKTDGKIYEQYIYNICNRATENGKPFVALKSNIVLD